MIPPVVKHSLSQMSKTDQRQFKKELASRERSVIVAYLAWLLFGCHYVYLGRAGMQLAFWLTGGFLLVGWIVDLFRVPSMVSSYNRQVAIDLMAQYKAILAG